MKLVASKPTVSIADPLSIRTGSGTMEIARVSVTADIRGDVSLNALPVQITTSGKTAQVIGPLSVQVNSSNLTIGGTINAVGLNSSTSSVITFGDKGYVIPAGSTVTFSLVGNILMQDTSDAIVTNIGDKANFVWGDIEGGATSTGSYIYNYPTAVSAYARY